MYGIYQVIFLGVLFFKFAVNTASLSVLDNNYLDLSPHNEKLLDNLK